MDTSALTWGLLLKAIPAVNPTLNQALGVSWANLTQKKQPRRVCVANYAWGGQLDVGTGGKSLLLPHSWQSRDYKRRGTYIHLKHLVCVFQQQSLESSATGSPHYATPLYHLEEELRKILLHKQNDVSPRFLKVPKGALCKRFISCN